MISAQGVKYIVVTIWASLLVTLMLDYGSQNSTFIAVSEDQERTITGVEGILFHIETKGFFAYAVSLAPTFLALLTLFVLLISFNQWRKSRERQK